MAVETLSKKLNVVKSIRRSIIKWLRIGTPEDSGNWESDDKIVGTFEPNFTYTECPLIEEMYTTHGEQIQCSFEG